MDLQLSGVLPSTSNDTLSVTNSKNKGVWIVYWHLALLQVAQLFYPY